MPNRESEEIGLVDYRVILIDASGCISTCFRTNHRREAAEYLAGLKEKLSKPGVRIQLIARPDPGWVLVKE